MPLSLRSRDLVLAAVVVGVAVPVAWLGTDALERNNDFCNACHIAGDVPLHIDLRREFDARPPASLAALHAHALPAQRPEDPVMRCFDCHAGVGLAGRAQVKWLAAKDLLVWLAGQAEEPAALTVPLRDADCTQCHMGFEDLDDGAPRGGPPFHSLDVHNHDLGVACTSCHIVHDEDVDEGFHFLAPSRVRAQCARCHSQFEN